MQIEPFFIASEMIYFIADLHLNEAQPQITEHFLQFMRQKAPLAESVYILGDFFDFWIGDDEQSALIDQVKNALKTLTTSGVKCYFICGNRDFLLGKRFAQETGIEILPDYYLLDLYGNKTLICHGDTLCIDDVKYQQFRRKVHQKWLQWLFLRLPLSLRIRIAQKIRAKSKQDKQAKSADIMDVNPAFTAETVKRFAATYLIHGHTHRQAVHSEAEFTRIVLGDWKADYASVLKFDEQGFEFI
ncbi:putative UDP-2,3-diacylglucosamine hydrolase [Actinobacillus pleuropneumoniae]|uniref:UDP-2,3-diacylglucosamine hydrolase n=2 Tax=Actinobacillus pleuropneumoniae TaxID=715 RepID=B0BSY0_ACTPJ|nr:UDP-2,3-diacylglucosamine diphosphatase [Actinobacillus pleuropneumoniae]ABY70394.1 UDP-2,3 diacylglucosamine hydrolase [Actinobacillus pleuropneumoniae serovar 3 str. JL03]EFM99892.1 UDP-2,3-diacylglucosamine hydrolase [Actinobacillus pleuropneumoniae serovar 12 str. 1096]KIE88596.1 putative UDP-2,3-diacylglucosamine hydrolase [Actinobacillus pleuropneumoniae]KIE88693.1 putative UDP-2,3-diacylglucosamine hydrolase [Actinobacillus pleuropneumoniae]KIE88792.1 putative UDP-2,3-diacylglucosami